MPLDENKLRYDHHKRKSKRRKGVKKNKTGKNRGKIQVGGGPDDETQLPIKCPFCTLFTTDKFYELNDTNTTSFETIKEIREFYDDGKVKRGHFKSIIVDNDKIKGKVPVADWSATSECKNSKKICVADKSFLGKTQLLGCGLTWGCTREKKRAPSTATGVSALYKWVVMGKGMRDAAVDLENLISIFKKKNIKLFTGGGGGGGPAAPISAAAGKKPVSTISTTTGPAASTSAATPAAATPAAAGESVPTQEKLDAKQKELDTAKGNLKGKQGEIDALKATAVQKETEHDDEKQNLVQQHQTYIETQKTTYSQQIDDLKEIEEENMREIDNLNIEKTKCEKEAKTFIKIGNNINFKIFDENGKINDGAFKVLENLKIKIDDAIEEAKRRRGGQSPESVVKPKLSAEGGETADVSSLLESGSSTGPADPQKELAPATSAAAAPLAVAAAESESKPSALPVAAAKPASPQEEEEAEAEAEAEAEEET